MTGESCNPCDRCCTYVVGSNMLESMKHCVAMGGAVAACAAAAAAPPPGTAGGPPTTAGAGGAMFNALAATAGSSNPVPAMMKEIQEL